MHIVREKLKRYFGKSTDDVFRTFISAAQMELKSLFGSYLLFK